MCAEGKLYGMLATLSVKCEEPVNMLLNVLRYRNFISHALCITS